MPFLTLPTTNDCYPYAILGLSFYIKEDYKLCIDFNETGDLCLTNNEEQIVTEKDIFGKLSTKLTQLRSQDAVVQHTFRENVNMNTNYEKLLAILQELDDYLAFHTFFATDAIGHQDWSVWGSVRGSIIAIGIVKNSKLEHLLRWHTYLESLESTREALAALANARSRISKAGISASFELFLPNATLNQVVTRFPPEPSGYLHIGHVKAAILNQYFAQKYNGKLIIRFDDTNPAKEKAEFEHAILEDLNELGIHGDKVSHTSDYFSQLFEYAVSMIRAGFAYVDDTERSKMNDERMIGIASACRDRTIDQNLEAFKAMKTGSPYGLRCCLRAKISVDSPNKTMRDPVIYRCNEVPHARTGTAWRIYPTYDFACPIIDSLEGVTHALRSNEYRDRNAVYAWMLNALQLRRVTVWDFSRLNFVYTFLSKRMLRDCLELGLANGWDDPRFPTFRGIKRRGMTVEALREFMLSQGPSQNQVLLEWDVLWTLNKKIIDPIAPRFWAIARSNAVPVHVKGISSSTTKFVPKHKKNPQLGEKVVVYDAQILIEQDDAQHLSANEEVTLMNWDVADIISVTRDAVGLVTAMVVKLKPGGDFKSTKKITWLFDENVRVGEKDFALVQVTLIDYDYLITKPKINKDEDISNWANPRTEFRTSAWADPNVATLRKGAVIQFERKGYYRVDVDLSGASQSVMEFIRIPDGRAAGVALKAGTSK